MCALEIQRQKRICFTDTDCLLLVLSPRDWYTKDIYESARRDFGKKCRHKYPHLALKRILFRSPSESVNRTLFIFGPRFCGWRLRKTFDLIKNSGQKKETMKHASKRKKWSKQQIKVAFSVNGLCSVYPDQAGKNGETLTRKEREVGPRSTFYSFLPRRRKS